MTIEQYITKINTLFQTGNAREHPVGICRIF
jgi:hypothetical protein